MAFVVKQVIVACLDYKDCNDTKATGKVKFEFDTSEITFFAEDEYGEGDGEKATFKIDDIRELIRVYDEQNALNPSQEKQKRKRK